MEPYWALPTPLRGDAFQGSEMFYWRNSKEGGKKPKRGADWQVSRWKQPLSCMWLKAGSQSLWRHSGSSQVCDAFHLPPSGFGLMGAEKFTAILWGADMGPTCRVYFAERNGMEPLESEDWGFLFDFVTSIKGGAKRRSRLPHGYED